MLAALSCWLCPPAVQQQQPLGCQKATARCHPQLLKLQACVRIAGANGMKLSSFTMRTFYQRYPGHSKENTGDMLPSLPAQSPARVASARTAIPAEVVRAQKAFPAGANSRVVCNSRVPAPAHQLLACKDDAHRHERAN
eukprot:GHUV01021271.1.p2 GENE.GHUV01021271.1~~GHUV01021271.1.p2  ORF type:complete len:139 (-),score=29.61 GHUV01021271.1:285-701(-)